MTKVFVELHSTAVSTQIYPIKAVLRGKNFKSADPTQFLRYNQNKNCSETSIPKGLR